MSPEDREFMNRLLDSQKVMTKNFAQISDTLMQQLASNAVLTAAVGALYAELAKVSGAENNLDTMLARITGVLESNSDSRGYVLKAADDIRHFAETLGK